MNTLVSITDIHFHTRCSFIPMQINQSKLAWTPQSFPSTPHSQAMPGQRQKEAPPSSFQIKPHLKCIRQTATRSAVLTATFCVSPVKISQTERFPERVGVNLYAKTSASAEANYSHSHQSARHICPRGTWVTGNQGAGLRRTTEVLDADKRPHLLNQSQGYWKPTHVEMLWLIQAKSYKSSCTFLNSWFLSQWDRLNYLILCLFPVSFLQWIFIIEIDINFLLKHD